MVTKVKIITKFEHELISPRDFERETDYLKFEKVCKSINKNFLNGDSKGSIFNFLSDGIKLSQYVGVIQFEQNKYVEILPKIYNNQSIKTARRSLSKLLSVHLGINPKTLEKVELNYDAFPILDIFAIIFINEINKIVKQGLKKKYKRVRSKTRYIKGKLIISQQIKNFLYKDRFFTEYEELAVDIPENIILKTALIYLKNKVSSREVRKKINQLLFIFSGISHATNYKKYFKQIHIDRNFRHYNYAIKLAKIFLSGKSFIPLVPRKIEREETLSLLFDMNLLFERYVTYILKRKYGEKLSIQEGEYYLLNDLQTRKKKFKLIPDMVLKNNRKIYIIDTKWKKLDQRVSNYKIDRSDVYQMFTYASIYQKENPHKKVNIVLIYPKHESLNKILKFEFRDLNNIRIYIVPFNLDKN